MDHPEKIAKAVIESSIPGAIMRYRENQSNSTHDFDLERPGTSVAAVEVTASADKRYNETIAAIRDPGKDGMWIKTKRCRKDWLVYPSPTAKINKIRKHVDQYLADIEIAGLERFFGPRHSDISAVYSIYQDLDIEAGHVTSWKQPGYIGITFPGGGGIITAEHVQKAVEKEAWKDDNRKKLDATGSEERHLFVYVDDGNYLPWAALRDKDPPLEPPCLPLEITHVWAVAEVAENCIVWRAMRGEKWEKIKKVSTDET